MGKPDVLQSMGSQRVRATGRLTSNNTETSKSPPRCIIMNAVLRIHPKNVCVYEIISFIYDYKYIGGGLNAMSFPTLSDPMDCSLSGSSVHGILQVRILEWVAISFSRGSSQYRDWTWVSCIAGRFFIDLCIYIYIYRYMHIYIKLCIWTKLWTSPIAQSVKKNFL